MSAVQPLPKSKIGAQSSPAAASAETAMSAADVAREMRVARARRLGKLVLFWVGLPTLVASIYLGAIAQDQYESTAALVVSSSHPAETATMLREYGRSRDMFERLERGAAFSKHYQESSDLIYRLPKHARSETRFKYFQDVVNVRSESQGALLRLRVRAFSGRDAERIANEVLSGMGEFLQSIEGESGSRFVVVEQPAISDEPTYPRRGYGVLTVFFTSLALFAIGSLLIAAVREHAQF